MLLRLKKTNAFIFLEFSIYPVKTSFNYKKKLNCNKIQQQKKTFSYTILNVKVIFQYNIRRDIGLIKNTFMFLVTV